MLTIGIFWLLAWSMPSYASLDCPLCTQFCRIRRYMWNVWQTPKNMWSRATLKVLWSMSVKPDWPTYSVRFYKAIRDIQTGNFLSGNILIGLSLLFLGYVLEYIPTPVLDGLFLYLAVTALYGNQMFERILLFFMEQSAYPPNHYIRKVPEKKMHMYVIFWCWTLKDWKLLHFRFTCCQLVQLGILCAFGFNTWPYAKMIFPLVILAFLPIRQLIIPKLIEKKFLDVLDGGDWRFVKRFL